jgi:hypothetical protein
MMTTIEPAKMIRPYRQITGMSAMLLPFQEDGAVDWDGFAAHLRRTASATAPRLRVTASCPAVIRCTIFTSSGRRQNR